MNIHSQIEHLKQLNLPTDQYIVVGSGTLAIHGIREAQDIDILALQPLWDELKKNNKVELNKWGVETIPLSNDIEILNPAQSFFGNSTIVPLEDIFKQAKTFEGIQFINLEHLKLVKEKLGRENDLKDIELIDAYLSNK